MRNWTLPVITVLAASLAACSVGPNHARPEMDLPDHFHGTLAADADRTGVGSSVEPADAAFWSRFNDPMLDRLVDGALVLKIKGPSYRANRSGGTATP
jgi:outer membrane protein TolC